MCDFWCQHYLFDLVSEHAAFNTQDSGDINVLLADGVKPGGETVQQSQEEHPGELHDVKHSLQDVIWSREICILMHMTIVNHNKRSI